MPSFYNKIDFSDSFLERKLLEKGCVVLVRKSGKGNAVRKKTVRLRKLKEDDGSLLPLSALKKAEKRVRQLKEKRWRLG